MTEAAAPPPDSAEPEQAAAEGSIAQSWQRMIGSVKAQLVGVIDLALLETKLAALSMVEMMALALAAALFAITAWWLLLAAITAKLMALGMSLAGALLLVGIVNVALAVIALLRIRKLSANLQFGATRAVLKSDATPPPAQEPDHAVEPPPTAT